MRLVKLFLGALLRGRETPRSTPLETHSMGEKDHMPLDAHVAPAESD